MAEHVVANRPASSTDFELVELENVMASSSQINPWIDPATIKLRHRIGRGLFGDVWLATYHQTAEDFEEYHEVAVKMLHPIKEDGVVLSRLSDLFSKCQGLENICWLQGISKLNGKVCIIMKFYEGSIGDKLARLRNGKLSVHDVLRYGADLAWGIMELHSKEILVLNLKPYNFLLNENDHALLGEIGIPYMFLGSLSQSSDMNRRLGTPNYMAPEQWQPDVRGPVSYETDSWGFGCSIVEMLTGHQPWSGKTIDEVYKSVVKNQEKPLVPDGLPPPVENVIIGCFEYDLRNRPLMGDILQAFESSRSAVYSDGGWTDLVSKTSVEKSGGSGYSEWFLMKDHLQIGDAVRSRKPCHSCKSENMDIPEGTIVGLENDTGRNGFVLVRVHGIHDPIRVHGSALERVTFGFAAGDWVRLRKEAKQHSPVGILHSIHRDGSVAVAFIGLETLWKGSYKELQMAESYFEGQFVRLRSGAFTPRFEWPRMRGKWATGRVSQVLSNGCLVVKFPGRLTFGDAHHSFSADPSQVEVVSFKTCGGVVEKYQHLEDFHWVVRPLLIALGLFTSMKLGLLVGKKIGRSKKRGGRNSTLQSNGQYIDGQNAGNSAWLPPQVANIIFREGVTTAPPI